MRLKVTFSLFSACFHLAVFSLSAQVTLENSEIKVTTDGKHIISLYDKKRAFEHVSDDYTSANGIFAISYVNSTTYAAAGTVNASSTTATLLNSGTNYVNYKLENDALTATVSFSLTDNRAEVSATISVELKNASYAVSTVDFPRFRTPQQHNGSYKQFLEPTVEGQTRSLSQAIQYWRAYPGSQTLQVGIVTFPAGGFSMWTNDTAGHVKSFGYMTGGGSANFAVRHFIPYTSNLWQSSYSTKIFLHGKDWQDGADNYREWATKQYWCATPLKQRTDVSLLLHNPPLVISTQVDKENRSTLPARLTAWSTKFGAPVIYRPLGWEKYGNWVGPDYFPSKIGDDNFSTLNSQLKAAGITVSGFPEPYHWVKSKTDGTVAENTALAAYYTDNNGPALCRTQISGVPWETTNENRLTSYICRGTDYGKTVFQTVAYKLFDMGVTHMHNDADHMVGLGGPCHNPAHGHPVPYGTWEADVMNQVFSEIKAEAKKRGLDDFILSRENGYEIQNMILTGYQTRNFQIISSRKNILPLFTYVYHDYIPAIFGLGTANAKRNIQLCAMVVYGQVPSLAFWNSVASEPTISVIDQISADVLKDYYDVMKTHGKDYLHYGKMLRPALTSAPGTLHNAWEDDKGNTGIFAVDTLDTNTTVTIKVPGSGFKTMKVYVGSELVSTDVIQGGSVINWDIPKWRLCSVIFTNVPVSDENYNYPKNNITIYPNPASDVVHIEMDTKGINFNVNIFDMTGKNIRQFTNDHAINISNLDSGLYMLSVSTGNGQYFHKLLKN
jgi:hypothetical protein